MNIRNEIPWIPIFIAVILFVFFIVQLIYVFHKKECSAQRMLSIIISLISLVFDIVKFILPGGQPSFISISGNNQSMAVESADNVSINNYLSIGLPSGSTVIFDGTDAGRNISYSAAEPVSPKSVTDAYTNEYEEVDTLLVGWSDNEGGRRSFTLDEINSGSVNPPIVFNSISDGKIGHEFNFVGARENTGEEESNQVVWNADTIEALEGKSYLVRVYAHNNNVNGFDGVAENVRVKFSLSPTVFVRNNDIALNHFNSANGYYGAAVEGSITSSNATPSECRDGVKFVSNRPFHLEYVPGTARLINAVSGNQNGFSLSDSIISDGVLIGYDEMNGLIPGCFQYDSQTTIIVIPWFDD